MNGIPLVEVARRARCSMPTAAQAVHDMCVPKVGTVARKNGTPAFTYPREAVEIVREYDKRKKERKPIP